MNSDNDTPHASHKPAHPIVFFFLLTPFGMFTGYLTVTLAYLFSRANVSIEQIAGLAALNFVPQVFKFIWAPLVDITFTLKKWYVFATIITSIAIAGTGIVPIKPSSLTILTIMIAISSIAGSFVGAAANGLAAHDTPEHLKGRVAGYCQAGNLGGGAVGGGSGLWLAQRLPQPWMTGAILGVACLLCCIALLFINEPAARIRVQSVGKTIANVLADVWVTIKTKIGVLAIILSLVPIGTSAASNLFAAAAKDWHASADVVALVNGVLGGLVTIVGCVAGGWICEWTGYQRGFVLYGFVQAATCLGMAFCPHTEAMYMVWTLAYAFAAGLAYAGYNAYTLEAIGKGAAASKFELIASISNAPIFTMTWVAGLAYARWGANGMLNTEAVVAIIGALLFMLISAIIKSKSSLKNDVNTVYAAENA